ncbi:MAG: tyrosine-type recombinase/integrase, partial [Nitrososphaeria archaeon]
HSGRRLTAYLRKLKAENTDDAELLLDFANLLMSQRLSHNRIHKYISHLRTMRMHMERSFSEAGIKDIRKLVAWINSEDYTPNTKRDMLIALRRFYQWLRAPQDEYPQWVKKHRYPEEVDWISTRIKKNETRSPEDLLTEEEVNAMIRAADSPMVRAFIALESEIGARPSEILGLRIKDVIFDGNDVYVSLHGKTGSRTIYIIKSVSLLSQWLSVHPRRDDPQAPLWVNRSNYGRLNRWGYRACSKELARLAERAGIKKKVTVYLFRHSAATRDARLGFTESQLCLKYGWVIGSRVPSVYLHLTAGDLREKIMQVYGGKPVEQPKPQTIECPRCHAPNHPSQHYCSNCGAPLYGYQQSTVIEELRRELRELRDMLLSLRGSKV